MMWCGCKLVSFLLLPALLVGCGKDSADKAKDNAGKDRAGESRVVGRSNRKAVGLTMPVAVVAGVVLSSDGNGSWVAAANAEGGRFVANYGKTLECRDGSSFATINRIPIPVRRGEGYFRISVFDAKGRLTGKTEPVKL